MNRLRVLLLVPSLQGGGEERVMVYLANHLDRTRYEPILAVGSSEGPFLDQLRDDVKIHVLGAKRARWAVPSIIRAVLRLRPGVVLSTLGMNFAAPLARLCIRDHPRLIIRQGTTTTAFLNEIEQQSRLRALLYRWSHQVLYRLADKVICLSDSMMDDLVANYGLSRNKMERIYNPVDIEWVTSLAGEDDPQTAMRISQSEGPHLLTIGNMSHAKACDVLLAAFRDVRIEYPQATLTFVGDGSNRASLEDLTSKLGLSGCVHFAGFQRNPFAYLRRADLFVSSSRYEGLPLVILEALAVGTPVVATDCPGGNREVIVEGVNGWLAKPDDPDSLARTICKGLREAPALDRDFIRSQCAQRFSIKEITRLHEGLFCG